MRKLENTLDYRKHLDIALTLHSLSLFNKTHFCITPDPLSHLSGFPLIEDSFTDRTRIISSSTLVTLEPFPSQKLLRSGVNLLFSYWLSYVKSPRHFSGPREVFSVPPSISSSAYRNRYFTQPISLSILTWIPSANQDLLKFPALAGAMNVPVQLHWKRNFYYTRDDLFWYS